MKIDNVVVGIIVLCFAALLLGDAYLTTYNPVTDIVA